MKENKMAKCHILVQEYKIFPLLKIYRIKYTTDIGISRDTDKFINLLTITGERKTMQSLKISHRITRSNNYFLRSRSPDGH